MIRSIKIENLLSFGSPGVELELRPLNVLIGPNASGKSNLIEVLSLLAAAPRDLQVPIRTGGGVQDWLWKGEVDGVTGHVVVRVSTGKRSLGYLLRFGAAGSRFQLVDEAIGPAESLDATNLTDSSYWYGGLLHPEELDANQSILSQRRGENYRDLTLVAKQFDSIRFYREWNLGRHSPPRLPQRPDLPGDFLLEDAANLGLVLNDLINQPGGRVQLIERLRVFYDRVTDVTTTIQGGTVQVFFHEEGLQHPIPATRLSDGTLRYLCLLAILCHPEPPPLICIEEPELGLHPDIIPEVGRLLRQASERTQLVVTTHSDVLVDSMSEDPESIVICEREEASTTMRRLDAAKLEAWLEDYRLGELWTRGDLGGTRW